MSFSDGSLEFNDNWHVEVGPGIGGITKPVFIPPTTATVVPANNDNPYMVVTIVGPTYSCMMAALFRPWMPAFIVDPTKVELTMDFILNTDAESLTSLQCLEADFRIAPPDGADPNGSFQNNYQQGGELQIYGVAPNPAWVSTGCKPGPFTPNVDHHVRIRYVTNSVANTCSTPWAEIDGVRYTFPANLMNVISQKLSWTDGIYLQLQLDLAYKGGSSVVKFKNVTVIWE